jgi:hypothetical protein
MRDMYSVGANPVAYQLLAKILASFATCTYLGNAELTSSSRAGPGLADAHDNRRLHHTKTIPAHPYRSFFSLLLLFHTHPSNTALRNPLVPFFSISNFHTVLLLPPLTT